MAINISVKNVPDDIARKLRERARRNHRSLQGELMAILEEASTGNRISFAEVEQHLKEIGLKTGDDSARWIREMRDAR